MFTQAHLEVHLRDYLYILRKRIWIVVIVFAAFVALGIFFTMRASIIYKATATILIERENPNVVDFKEVMAFDASTSDYYQTQYQILKSRSLVEQLIEVEDLTSDPFLNGMKKGGLRRLIKDKPILSSLLAPFLTDRTYASLFKKRMLEVEPVANSRLVYVSVYHVDPETAARLVNKLVGLYITKNLESRYLMSEQARGLLAEQLDNLKVKVALAEKRLQRYKEENGLVSIPSVREKDEFIQEARMELMRLQADEAQLAKRYLPAHPKYIHIASQIEAIQEKIKEEEMKKLKISNVAIDFGELEREAQSSRQTYESLLSRFEEMHSEAKTQASNIIVVDTALPPERPSKPRPFLNMLIAAFLGVFFGALLAFFFEYLDATIKVPDDIDKGLGLELFGIIPKAHKDKRGPLGGEIFSAEGKHSQTTEAFRALRTSLLFKLKAIPGCRTIVVTSPNPSEGKSTISLNLAASFQQNHMKVLLIDSDLRKPKLHSRIGIDHDIGLSDLLEGGVAPDEAIISNVQSMGFDFLTSGTQSSRPTELLDSDNMNKLMSCLRDIYDIIIIDSPPYLAVADATVLCNYTDAMITVTKYQQTEKRHLQNLTKRFAVMDEKIMGVVINQVNVRERDYYYHQYYYYGYGDTAKKK